jgi:NitT/TauT family transport system substrate-binding protein
MTKHNMLAIAISAAMLGLSGTAATAAEKCHIAWSHYTGWEPAGYIEDTGIAKKWGEKFGVDLQFVHINDYIESVNQYAAGQFQGVTVTNMDGLKGKTWKLVELSVSHYLAARALDEGGMSERDVTVVNTSDADLGGLIASSKPGDVFVTWNPILMAGRQVSNMELVFDSSQTPGEIIDTIMVGTNTSDACKSAITGAWYEGVAAMQDGSALEFLADQAGGTVAEFKAQLETTRMFYDPAEGAAFAASPQVKNTMVEVARFSFDHGLYGDGAPSEQFVGIEYPDGSVWGDAGNVKLRFDNTFMLRAANGEL